MALKNSDSNRGANEHRGNSRTFRPVDGTRWIIKMIEAGRLKIRDSLYINAKNGRRPDGQKFGKFADADEHKNSRSIARGRILGLHTYFFGIWAANAIELRWTPFADAFVCTSEMKNGRDAKRRGKSSISS